MAPIFTPILHQRHIVATYIPRGDKVRAQINLKGVRDGRTFPSKGAAKAWATKREAEILSLANGELPDKVFEDLLQRYRDEVSPGKRGARWEVVRIDRVLGRGRSGEADPLAKVHLRELTGTHVSQWRDRRLAAGLKGSSVQREWNLLSDVCSVAISEWKWLRENPFAASSGVRRPPAPPHRDEVVLESDLQALQAVADAEETPTYRRVMRVVRFAMETGMRAGEIIFLGDCPAMVNADSRVASLPKTKNGSKREVPLSLKAVELWYSALEDQGERSPTRLDNVWGFSSMTLDTHWRGLRSKVALNHPPVTRLHFHDTRHTAATNIAKKLQLLDLCRMFGWRDPKRAMTYYNETAADIALKL